jgi:formate/nitrite transporter FocA (FNT family)
MPDRAMRLNRPAMSEPDQKERCPMFINNNFRCSMPWRDTRVTPVLVLIIIVIVYSTNLAGNVRAVLTLVITAVMTAAAEELVRAAALPS